MPINHQDNLRYFQFNNIQTRHAIFTRHGGLSPEPWDSLNVGGTVGDEKTRVRANRNLSLKALGCSPESVFDVWQVHSADVVFATVPRPDSESVQQADIILTDKPDLTLYMRFADCVPIMVRSTQGCGRGCTCWLDGNFARCRHCNDHCDEETIWLQPG